MNCPLEAGETNGLLLDYCARKLSPEQAATFERHLHACPACRKSVEGQRSVWAALGSWEEAPVSRDFDRKLYARIECGASWWERISSPLRPLWMFRGAPAAAAVCLAIAAGLLLNHSHTVPPPAKPESAIIEVQPEQVEEALDTMDMLSDFSHQLHNTGTGSKL